MKKILYMIVHNYNIKITKMEGSSIMKKFISVILAATMLGTTFVPCLAAETAESHNNVRIVANGNSPINITASDAEVAEQGIFAQERYSLRVERDYEQYRDITVKNTGTTTTKFYLSCGTYSEDLAINFIKGGSKDEPILLKPGEEKDVTLAIFAQNAQKSTYEFEVFAYQVVGGEEQKTSKAVVSLNVNLRELDITVTKSDMDEYTLAQPYAIRNNAYYDITDITVTTTGEIANYAAFDSIINNYNLKSHDTLEFELIPDLNKIVEDKKQVIEGSIIISGMGDSKEEKVSIDVTGKNIISNKVKDIILEQSGNPLVNMQVDENSIEVDNDNYANTNEAKIGMSYTTTYGNNNEGSFNTDVDIKLEKNIDNVNADDVNNVTSKIQDGKIYIQSTQLINLSEATTHSLSGIELMAEEDDEILMIINAIIEIPENMEGEEAEKFKEYYEQAQRDVYINSDNKEIDLIKIWDAPNDVLEDSTKEKIRNYLDLTILLDMMFPINDDGVHVINNEYINIVKEFFKALFGTDTPDNESRKLLVEIIDQYKKETDNHIEMALDEINEKEKEKEYNPPDSGKEKIPHYHTQCTNRGKIETECYIRNCTKPRSRSLLSAVSNSATEQQARIFYTGRMYGQGYVNNEPINYDYYINDKKVFTGQNNGLTEVNIIELPIDAFVIGEKNTFIRDYDTNPGSHAVTADNTFTIIYPSDTEICTVDGTNTLSDMKLKSDYAVYDENIYIASEPVLGKPNKIKVNYNNIGAQSGYYSLDIYVNGTKIDSIDNEFMRYFTSSTAEFDWTPSATENKIEVKINNSSAVVEDENNINNVAQKSVTAREPQIPNITAVEPTGEIEQSSEAYVSATIEDNADVAKVEFYVDDKKVEKETENSGTSYWVTADIQSIGQHKATVKVTDTSGKEYSQSSEFNVIQAKNKYEGYRFGYTAYEIYATKDVKINLQDYIYVLAPVEGKENSYAKKELSDFADDITIDYAEDSGLLADESNKFILTPTVTGYQNITLTLGVNSRNFAIRAYDTPCKIAEYDIKFEGNSYPYVNVYQKSEDNTWDETYDYSEQYSDDYKKIQVIFAPDEFTTAENYIVVIRDENGNSAVLPFKEGITEVDTKNNVDLTFTKNSKVKINSLSARLYLGEETVSTIYSSSKIGDSISLPKQKYELRISFTYEDEYYSVTTDVDLTSGNKELDVVSLLNIVNVELKYDSPSKEPQILVAGEYGWEYVNTIKVNEKNYNIVIEDEDMLENIDDYTVYAIDNNNMYSAKLAKDNVVVNDAERNAITFKDDAKAQVKSIVIKTIGEFYSDIPLQVDMKKAINLPKNTYTLAIQYLYDNVNLYAEYNIDLTAGSKEIDLSESAGKANCTIAWSDVYADTAYLDLWQDGDMIDSYSEYNNNTGRVLNDGAYEWSLRLNKGNVRYNVENEFEISDNSKMDIMVGDEFNGILTSYYNRDSYLGNNNYTFTVADLKDSAGNLLSSCTASGNNSGLRGKVIFTNVNDENDIHEQEVTYSNLYSTNEYSSRNYSVQLPNVNGTYNVQLILEGYSINPPVASVKSGEYSGRISVELTSDTKGANIYYTLDGTNPTESSTKYTRAISISSSCTLKAIAVSDGNVSSVASYEYIIKRSTSGGGGFGGGGIARYTVTISYMDENGSSVGTSKVTKTSGSTITDKDLNVPKGYELDDSVSHKVTKNETIEVTVKKASAADTETPEQTTKPSNEQNSPNVAEKAYINGYEDGSFRPNNNITRAEVSTLIYNLLGNNQISASSALDRFADIPSTHWGRVAIGYNIENGYMSGDAGSNTFRPDASMTRAELAQLLANLKIKTNGNVSTSFTDVDSHWAKTAIETMARCGVISGYEDGTFKPDNTVTRAEAVAMISRLFDRSSDWNGNITFNDVSASLWAYNAIMNAVNGK